MSGFEHEPHAAASSLWSEPQDASTHDALHATSSAALGFTWPWEPTLQPVPGVADAMEGMVDVALARVELADKFEVIKPGEVATKPNQVTEEQLQKLCQTYSDIRRNKTDIKLNTSGMDPKQAAKFKQGTMGTLATIMQTETGRDLIANMAYQPNAKGEHKTVSIGGGEATKDAMTSDDSSLEHDPRQHDGTGLNSKVFFNPWKNQEVEGGKDAWLPTMTPDVTLYHELVHASHLKNGDVATGLVTSGHDHIYGPLGEKLAEHQVVGLSGHDKEKFTENKYRAERKKMGEAVPQRDYVVPDVVMAKIKENLRKKGIIP